MFRRYSFDVTNIVNEGSNTIEFQFESAESYATAKVKIA